MTAASDPRITPGRRFPAGATPDPGGVNFSIFSREATWVELLLYASADAEAPAEAIPLDPAVHRTSYFWHVHVAGIEPGAAYAWRVDGPDDASISGRRFNANKELLDPFARAVSHARYDRALARDPSARGSHLPRAIVAEPLPHDPGPAWTHRDLHGAIIYELNVGAFTRHPSSGVRHPGTFSGLVEKIPHLVDLGITHVELLPVMAFDVQDVPPGGLERGLRNLWGYSPYAFHAPHPDYLVSPGSASAPREFRDMVDALHEAGIGVLLDVVLNHTAEAGEAGPWISFKGLFNEIFYILDPEDRRRYLDFTGCGNTINCNHPLVSELLLRALEWWSSRLRVDGFRFDLASVLTRGQDGRPLQDPALPWQIEFSRPMSDRALIAEAWDAGGLHHVGSFPGFRWAEWNGRYKDVVRRFAGGEAGLAGEVASRMAGSADFLADSARGPSRSVNYVASHDGFTLWDAVSYSHKHNEANLEGNRDGRDDEPSRNWGVEGATDDAAVLAARKQDARNMLAVLMLSLGTPMILAGDEMLRSQRGNNNPYCQDDEISWIDWTLRERNADFLRFTHEMIAFRRRHPALLQDRFLTGRMLPSRGLPDVAWHGESLGHPPWTGGAPCVLACTLAEPDPRDADVHAILNFSGRDVLASLPPHPGRRWFLAADTSRSPPDDVVPPDRQMPVPGATLTVPRGSVVILEGRG